MVSIAREDFASGESTALSAWAKRARFHTVASVPTPTTDEAEYQKRLGRAIVQLRNAAGMSQATLAETIGRSEAALSRWENGKATPSAYDLRRIALAVEMPAEITDVLIFPPAVYEPVMERLFAKVQEHLSRATLTETPDRATIGLIDAIHEEVERARASGGEEGARQAMARITGGDLSSLVRSVERPPRGTGAKPR